MNSSLNKFEAKEQKGSTCYANAIAASIYLASVRVYGRLEKLRDEEKKNYFFDVRKKFIDIYRINGRHTFKILKDHLHEYKLHSNVIDERNARMAVIKGRGCVAKFYLNAQQWGIFLNFIKKIPKEF